MATTTNPIPQNLTPTIPSLKDLLDLFAQNLMIRFNCHHIGTIQSFNSEMQTATATINYQKTIYVSNPLTNVVEAQQQQYPTLLDCPVIVLGGGPCSLTFPIQSGDTCLILFNDRDMDNWFSGSTTNTVATPRLHSFSDGIILVGLHSMNNSLQSYDMENAVLQNGTTKVAVGTSLITIANSMYTLGSLLQNLCTDLQNLITALTSDASTFVAVASAPGPGILNPAIITALTSVSTSLSTLSSQLGNLLQ